MADHDDEQITHNQILTAVESVKSTVEIMAEQVANNSKGISSLSTRLDGVAEQVAKNTEQLDHIETTLTKVEDHETRISALKRAA